MPTLTPSVLVESQVLAEKMFADSARKADYVVEVDAAKAIIENTTADVTITENSQKEQTASIKWSKFCNDDVEETELASHCDPSGGDAADSAKKDYIISSVISKKFTIDEGNYKSNFLNFPEVYADNMLKSLKSMDEKLAKMIVAKVQSFTSENLYQVTGIACPGVVSPEDWTETYIKPSNWSPSIMGYFAKVARLNKFNSPFLLDGKNLFDLAVAAQVNQGNANGKGDAAWFNLMKIYNDIVNVEAVASGSTFMIQRGATAFASKVFWGSFNETNPKDGASDLIKYSVPSRNIPGVKYDVYVKRSCSGKYDSYNVGLELNFDVFNGAEACNGATGVLEFICGNCPS